MCILDKYSFLMERRVGDVSGVSDVDDNVIMDGGFPK